MAESSGQTNKANTTGSGVLSEDDAVLNSFFDLVASIAVRLTKDATTRHNDGKESTSEIKK